MGKELQKMEVKETGDIVFWLRGERSKFIEGQEFVKVVRFEGDKVPSFMLKNSLKLRHD